MPGRPSPARRDRVGRRAAGPAEAPGPLAVAAFAGRAGGRAGGNSPARSSPPAALGRPHALAGSGIPAGQPRAAAVPQPGEGIPDPEGRKQPAPGTGYLRSRVASDFFLGGGEWGLPGRMWGTGAGVEVRSAERRGTPQPAGRTGTGAGGVGATGVPSGGLASLAA